MKYKKKLPKGTGPEAKDGNERAPLFPVEWLRSSPDSISAPGIEVEWNWNLLSLGKRGKSWATTFNSWKEETKAKLGDCKRQGSGSRRNYEGYNSDPLYLFNFYFPGVQLVNVKLNGSNFHKWSRVVKITLKTKTKLGFINGSYARPAFNSPDYNQWIHCDNMVVRWLLNSMVNDLTEAFL